MKIEDFVDMHVHIGPEPIPRRFTLQELMDEEKGRIGGMVLKNHFYPTMPIVKSMRMPDGLTLIGSVVLNNYVGGLNPDAVYGAAKISELPLMVWFPTINAKNFLENSEYEIRPEWVGEGFGSRLSKDVKGIGVLDGSGKLTAQAMEVLRAIKDNDCILATGHVSSEEARAMVTEALGMGIRRIVLTHPMYQLIDMPIDMQKELTAAKGVYVEVPYSMHSIDGISMSQLARNIREVGPERCIISSDTGQINRPSPSEIMADYVDRLKAEGIDDEALHKMGSTNPNKLITR